MTVQTGSRFRVLLVFLALAVLVGGGGYAMYTGNILGCDDCKIIKAQVQSRGVFSVTMLVTSRLNGGDLRVNKQTYDRDFVDTVQVLRGDVVTVELTAIAYEPKARVGVTCYLFVDEHLILPQGRDTSIWYPGGPLEPAICKITVTNL